MGGVSSREMQVVAPVDTCNEESYEIGIVKNKNSDVNFHEAERNMLLVDNGLISSPYHLCSSSISSKHLALLHKLMTEERWKKEVLEPVLRIIRTANEKRTALHQLLSMNPYLPWYKRNDGYFADLYYECLDNLDELDVSPFPAHVIIPILKFLCAIFIGIPSFLLSVCQTAFYFLSDILCCRLSVFRGGEMEKRFVHTVLQGNPEYDTVVIDETIGLDLYQLSKSLSEQFAGEVLVQYHFSRKKIIDDHVKDIYEQDYKYLLFLFKNPDTIRRGSRSSHRSSEQSNNNNNNHHNNNSNRQKEPDEEPPSFASIPI
jgi:hypothetical protein